MLSHTLTKSVERRTDRPDSHVVQLGEHLRVPKAATDVDNDGGDDDVTQLAKGVFFTCVILL